jgi:two-component system phosphate regulon sensor histidine kinase PhoR
MIIKHSLVRATKHTLNLERGRLNSLINSMADGVLAIDEKDHVVVYNGAALNILDLNSSVTGTRIDELLRLIDKNNQPVDLTELIRSAKTALTNRDYRLVYKDKSTINLYVSIAPVHLGFGKAGSKGHVFLLRDITHEKALEEERDEFISVIAHELRTPIAIAEGSISNAQFINQKHDDPAKTKIALKKAHEQMLFLADMVNDLATLSRADGDKLSLEVESVNVHDLIEDLVQGYSPQAESKGLKLVKITDGSLELLRSSHLYVREILQNFITNSIKYTEEGSVSISAKPTSKGVLFKVSDTGIGISQADKEKIFDKFFRSNDERAQRSSGKGLGLYISLKLARLLHAELEVESQIDKGSVFSIFIPNLN